MCRTVLTVKAKQPPEIIFCPESFEIQLDAHETSRAVQWKEAEFKSFSPLKHIFKSKIPGQPLTPGTHQIEYIATDIDEQTAKCSFNIEVKGEIFIYIYFIVIF